MAQRKKRPASKRRVRAKRAWPKAQDKGDRKLLADVKKYGWHVILVPGQDGTPGWAFTVGLYETFRQPEVILVGLKLETMQALLNGVGQLVRRGLKLKDKLKSVELIRGLPCEFRAVATRWHPPLLGYMRWFYQGEDTPVLQCTWPDREGRLLSSPAFDKAMRRAQPALWETTARKARLVDILKTLEA